MAEYARVLAGRFGLAADDLSGIAGLPALLLALCTCGLIWTAAGGVAMALPRLVAG